jgi:RNA recognition motif-containing protein
VQNAQKAAEADHRWCLRLSFRQTIFVRVSLALYSPYFVYNQFTNSTINDYFLKMKLYVGNLGDGGTITSDDLRPLFETYGAVTECECIKNYAFVHMDDEAAAEEAVRNLNGTSVKGRSIKVEKSESKGPRKPSQKLFVGNLAEGTTDDQLRQLFERFAPVMEADVIKNFGFVHIDADAGKNKVNEILRELNGYNLNGCQTQSYICSVL